MTMNINDELKEELKDKDYRDSFVASHIDYGIALQIRSLRKRNDWTQKELGEKADMKQARISLLEDPNRINFNLTTLRKIASAFDVALMIRFVSFGDLVNCDKNVSEESLRVVSFPDDPYFKEQSTETLLTSMPEEALRPKVISIAEYKSALDESGSSLKKEDRTIFQQEPQKSLQQAICGGQ